MVGTSGRSPPVCYEFPLQFALLSQKGRIKRCPHWKDSLWMEGVKNSISESVGLEKHAACTWKSEGFFA